MLEQFCLKNSLPQCHITSPFLCFKRQRGGGRLQICTKPGQFLPFGGRLPTANSHCPLEPIPCPAEALLPGLQSPSPNPAGCCSLLPSTLFGRIRLSNRNKQPSPQDFREFNKCTGMVSTMQSHPREFKPKAPPRHRAELLLPQAPLPNPALTGEPALHHHAPLFSHVLTGMLMGIGKERGKNTWTAIFRY